MQCLRGISAIARNSRWKPEWWRCPTHVERSPELMKRGDRVGERGAHVDIDVQEEDLAHLAHLLTWTTMATWRSSPCRPMRRRSGALTRCSSRSGSVRVAIACRSPELLALVTSNTADVLGAEAQGTARGAERGRRPARAREGIVPASGRRAGARQAHGARRRGGGARAVSRRRATAGSRCAAARRWMRTDSRRLPRIRMSWPARRTRRLARRPSSSMRRQQTTYCSADTTLRQR